MQISLEAPKGFETLPAEQQKRILASVQKSIARQTLADLLQNSPAIEGVDPKEQLDIVEAEQRSARKELARR